MNPPLTYLCPAHSSRQTQSQGCADCQRQKHLVGHDRRIRELEKKIERIEAQLAALETTETVDTPKVEA